MIRYKFEKILRFYFKKPRYTWILKRNKRCDIKEVLIIINDVFPTKCKYFKGNGSKKNEAKQMAAEAALKDIFEINYNQFRENFDSEFHKFLSNNPAFAFEKKKRRKAIVIFKKENNKLGALAHLCTNQCLNYIEAFDQLSKQWNVNLEVKQSKFQFYGAGATFIEAKCHACQWALDSFGNISMPTNNDFIRATKKKVERNQKINLSITAKKLTTNAKNYQQRPSCSLCKEKLVRTQVVIQFELKCRNKKCANYQRR